MRPTCCRLTPFTANAQEAKPAVTKTKFNVIPIFTNDDGSHFFTMVRIEGKEYPFIDILINGKHLSFLIDSGSGANIIEPSVAKKMNIELHTESATFTDAGKGKTAIIDKPLFAKKVQLAKILFYLIETNATAKAPKGVEFGGVLGTTRLKLLKAFLDYGSHSLLILKTSLQKK